MKYILFITIIITNIFAVNSDEFNIRQEKLIFIKQIIQEEESIARAYEEFMKNELKRPATLSELITDDYLGSAFKLSFTGTKATYFNDHKIVNDLAWSTPDLLYYKLKDVLKNDYSLKNIYESNKYRERTVFVDAVVTSHYIKLLLKDNFTKSLSFFQGGNLSPCSPGEGICYKNNHIYIYHNISGDLVAYFYIDNLETGPIIITDDVTLHDYSALSAFAPGTKLIDFKNQNYVKTIDSIKKVQ